MNKLKELEDKADKLAKEIQWNEEWIRLSIVEKTALMAAYGASELDLDGAIHLFFEIKKNNEWHHRNLKNNHQPYQTDLERRIKALKKELRTPEEIAASEAEALDRLARRRMYS